jgi:isopenicillin-N epimerase
MTPSAEQFRELFMLDPEVTYLNHGSFGAVPRPVFETQNELRRELEREPVLFLARRLRARLARVRRSIARYVGAASKNDLGLVPNVTTGLNAVARSVELRSGDEILLTDHEYGAKRILWDEVAARSPARRSSSRNCPARRSPRTISSTPSRRGSPPVRGSCS